VRPWLLEGLGAIPVDPPQLRGDDARKSVRLDEVEIGLGRDVKSAGHGKAFAGEARQRGALAADALYRRARFGESDHVAAVVGFHIALLWTRIPRSTRPNPHPEG
jgi:hypothetical protein